jgi:hypothetical protein
MNSSVSAQNEEEVILKERIGPTQKSQEGIKNWPKNLSLDLKFVNQ